MNIIYIVDFDVSGSSGKNKATREKAKALSLHQNVHNFLFISLPNSNSKWIKYTYKLFFDLYVLKGVLFLKKEQVVIQRVLFLPLSRCYFFLRSWKVVSEYHADFKEEIPLLKKSDLFKKLLYVLNFLFVLNYKLSDGIIYNHPNLLNKFKNIYKKPSIYCYNGSNTEEFFPLKIKESRIKIGWDLEPVIFLFLGSISKWHGVEYLVDIFNTSLLLNNPKYKLHIVGDITTAYAASVISRNSSDTVQFFDKVPVSEANVYLNACNIGCIPVNNIRTSPGSPLKLYDIAATGKPIVTQSGVLGYEDEVLKYNLGIAIDFKNPISASKEIVRFTETLDYNKYLENNRKKAKIEISWQSRMDQWMEFITKEIYK